MDSSLRNAMEMCRDATDLSQQEMAELRAALLADAHLQDRFATICAADALIRERITDVDVPAGLEQRVLAGLSETTPPPSRIKRRTWLAIGGVAAAVALVVGLPFLINRDSSIETSVAHVQSSAKDNWLRAVVDLPDGQWSPAEESLPTRVVWEFPQRTAVLPVGIGNDESSRDLRARAYQLPGQAYLVTVKLPSDVSVANVSKGPPRIPFKTGGWAIGVWQEGGTLYVLMVQGGQEEYAKRLKRPELT